jgi:glutamate carboxypeptidase
MSKAQIYGDLQRYLETNQPFYFDLLKQMVKINSFTMNRNGVNAVGRLTAQLFGQLGFNLRVIPAEDARFGDHLILIRPGRSGRRIGLVSHLDTVFSKDEERRNHFVWQQVGDKIYGPGVNDIKGGTVMIYMILAAMQAITPELYDEITWVILFNAAEEELSPDFGQLCRQELRGEALACLVFENGSKIGQDCSVVVARKGRATYHVTVHGKGAHAGSAHQEGANAVLQLADTVQRVAGLTDYERDLTFNVGVAAGGTVINRVPHYASAAVEMRAFSPAVFDEGVARMLALSRTAQVRNASGDYTCRVNIDVLSQTMPWPKNQASERLLATWQVAAAELGQNVVPEARGGLSDGNWLWPEVPTLDGLGPLGENSHCSEQIPAEHKEQEYVLASSFVPKALLNIAAISKLIGNAPLPGS